MPETLRRQVEIHTSMQRHLGIDALRILAMFMVVLLHVLGQGGVLLGGNDVTLRYSMPWLLETMAYCAVNCYGLITGYVCIHSHHKYKRIVALWFQVFFYTTLITLITALVNPGTLGKEEFYNAVFPMLRKQYWYFTQYTGLFFLMPFLNKLLLGLSKQQMQGLVLTIFVFLSLLPCIIHNDLLISGSGYSMLWLAALYVIGAYIKRYGFTLRCPKPICLLIYSICTFIAWGGILLQGAGIMEYGRRFLNYTSPFILCSALALFFFFLQCNFSGKASRNMIPVLAPVSFGVFLIHTHPLIYQGRLKHAFTFFHNYPVVLTLLFCFLAALAIYLLCSLIDYLRLKLFGLLHIDALSEKIVVLCRNMGMYIYNKLMGRHTPV